MIYIRDTYDTRKRVGEKGKRKSIRERTKEIRVWGKGRKKKEYERKDKSTKKRIRERSKEERL